ncbi:hypothetical protein CS8_077060 [Cupriavidus sp. 8B]
MSAVRSVCERTDSAIPASAQVETLAWLMTLALPHISGTAGGSPYNERRAKFPSAWTLPLMTRQPAASQSPLAKQDFEALSDFRYQLRRFLRFSEDAAQNEGLTVQQYLLMLHIRGCAGKDWASIGELAERLQAKQHGVVALVNRCEAAGLVKRKANPDDRRIVEVHLMAKGERFLNRLAMLHRSELESLRGTFRVARLTAFNDDGAERA